MLYLPRSGKAALMSALRRPHIGGMKSVVFEGGEIIFPLTAQWASVKDTSCGNQGDVAALLCLSVCLLSFFPARRLAFLSVRSTVCHSRGMTSRLTEARHGLF